MDPVNHSSPDTPSLDQTITTTRSVADVPSQSTTVESSSKRSQLPVGQWFKRLLNGMSWYGLELGLSTLGLFVTLAVTVYGIFALVNYLAGIDNPMAQQFMGEFSLWVAAMMTVWLPLTVYYYVRARHETDRYPEHETRLLHKAIVGFYSFNVVVTLAGLGFTVVYAVIRMAVGIDDTIGDTALRIVLPATLGAVVTAGFLLAYARHSRVTHRVFILVVTCLSLGLVVALLVMAVSSVQGNDRDQKAAADLQAISNEMERQYDTKNNLPDTLGELSGLQSETKQRLERYRYVKENGARYQLCATFATNTMSGGTSKPSDQEYTTYADFDSHGTGEKCFKLSASYTSSYDDSYRNYFESLTPDSSEY